MATGIWHLACGCHRCLFSLPVLRETPSRTRSHIRVVHPTSSHESSVSSASLPSHSGGHGNRPSLRSVPKSMEEGMSLVYRASSLSCGAGLSVWIQVRYVSKSAFPDEVIMQGPKYADQRNSSPVVPRGPGIKHDTRERRVSPSAAFNLQLRSFSRDFGHLSQKSLASGFSMGAIVEHA